LLGRFVNEAFMETMQVAAGAKKGKRTGYKDRDIEYK
jgi:hypothetical protein